VLVNFSILPCPWSLQLALWPPCFTYCMHAQFFPLPTRSFNSLPGIFILSYRNIERSSSEHNRNPPSPPSPVPGFVRHPIAQLPRSVNSALCVLCLRTATRVTLNCQRVLSLAVKTLKRHSTDPEFESPWERISGCGYGS